MNILFRADGNARIATGHVMRCLTIAEAIADAGGKTVFVSAELTPSLRQRIQEEGCELIDLSSSPYSKEDAQETARIAQERGISWVVIDGYGFDSAYQQVIKNCGLKLFMVDDYGHAEHYVADIVFNQNMSATEALYKNREPSTRLLLGVRFALLRRMFRKWKGYNHAISSSPSSFLITMGGADPHGTAAQYLQWLANISPSLQVTVLVGGAVSSQCQSVLERIASDSELSVCLKKDVKDMPSEMEQADIALTAGGSTIYECAFMGLPVITTIIAENQEPGALAMEREGASANLGWYDAIDSETFVHTIRSIMHDQNKRENLSLQGRRLIDGEGVDRVLMELQEERLRLRDAREEDCKVLWEWINDSAARQNSFSSVPIPWGEHCKWFKQKLTERQTRIYIAVDRDDLSIGVIRFEMKNSQSVISIMIAPSYRGKGMGRSILNKGISMYAKDAQSEEIHAYIKPENEASLALFQKAGFTKVGTTSIQQQPAIHFSYCPSACTL